jgi:type IV pilus assembly protein PilZ
VIEKRRYSRAAIDLPVLFVRKGEERWAGGTGKDISIGGIFIETDAVAPFAAEIVVRVQMKTASGGLADFDLPGVVRWVRDGGMGVQFGNLGVHETHAITELKKQRDA